jgi:hypothetical protein
MWKENNMDKPIDDGDYELTDGKAWLSAKGFAIRIHTTDEGIVVDIYKKGNEDAAAIASTYAFDNELDDEESIDSLAHEYISDNELDDKDLEEDEFV